MLASDLNCNPLWNKEHRLAKLLPDDKTSYTGLCAYNTINSAFSLS